MSPVNAIGNILFLTRISLSLLYKDGPDSRQSLIEGLEEFGRDEQSYTTLSLVLSASSLMTALCGM